jgi:alkylation response protein AidB-like acyl-CoA dehydrogenase
MFLAPDGDELEVAAGAAEILGDVLAIGRLHQHGSADLSERQCRSLGEMGWLALAVPEERGGSGLGFVQHALFFREAGRQCAPVDLLATCLAANFVTDPVLRGELLAGGTPVALLVEDGGVWRGFGRPEADLAIAVTGDRAAICDLAGARRLARPSLDPANSQWVIEGALNEIEARDDPRIRRLGQLGTAAMLVGIAEAALDLIVEYAKVRETFGRKIGAYQAVRHPCADMAVRAEAARCQFWYAAAALDEGRPDADTHLDAAKHTANTAALANADWNIQLHGGIGVAEEHDAHLLLKHALLLTRLFGAKRTVLARLLHARLDS